MQKYPRKAGIALIFALFIGFFSVLNAQVDGPVTIVGSKSFVELILPLLNEMSEADLDSDAQITGTTEGVQKFCLGEVAVLAASRALTDFEETLCTSSGIQFSEYLLGYEILAVVTHPEIEAPTCLTNSNLNTLFAPSAVGQTATWRDTGLNDLDIPLSVYLPEDDSPVYSLLDNLVNGFGLRRDAAQSVEDVADHVSKSPGAIGITTLAEVAGRSDLNVLDLNTTNLNECSTPSETGVANRQYEAAIQHFLYVNTDLQDDAVTNLLTLAFGEDSVALIAEAGLTPVSAEAMEQNRRALAGETEGGRQFSQPTTTFEIPASVSGEVRISGSTNPVDYLASVRQQFTSLYPSVSFVLDTFGESSAIESFCTGESDIDILSTAAPLNAEQSEACEGNGVDLISYSLGNQAVVLLGNAGDDFVTCLTTEQIRRIWASTATNNLSNWNEVIDGAPEQEIFTIAPSSGSASLASMMLATADGPTLPMRTDPTEYNNDPLYRAVAVSNASGTITFMSWPAYQEVLNSEIEGYQLIAVDAGNGCIEPSPATLSSLDYPYSKTGTLTVDRTAFVRPQVQSVLWYIFGDENFRLLESSGYSGGITLADLPKIRAELEEYYAEAALLAAEQEDDSLSGFDPLAEPETTNPSTESEATPPMGDQ